jgi:nucleolar pre-ribosomal-associated protein 1
MSYLSSPPPLSAILENIIPTAFSKDYLSKGLQSHKDPLVIHCTALALAKIISKFEAVRKAFKVVEEALEESSENGLWRRRRAEVEGHVRRRVPEFQVIVALVQKYAPSQQVGEVDTAKPLAEPSHAITRHSMLAEVALRAMWLYHRSLSELVAETRFEAGKLLHYISSPLAEASTSASNGMNLLSQLHVLRLLKESDQFAWSSKFGTTCMVMP